ncbi:hypothetical protein [Agromyces sp. H66]|uniref:hypothetical protein n=1 Tax=Agromyces sp. H66 TaxID=2529859 RepID=UPI00145ACE7A|nr:hypothetical protein [Agromyces sp. H66]
MLRSITAIASPSVAPGDSVTHAAIAIATGAIVTAVVVRRRRRHPTCEGVTRARE